MAPYIGILRAAGIAKEVAVGTLNDTPDAYIPYIPPDGFSPDIAVLESAGVRAQPDKVVKATQGPATIKGAKLKFEAEPENMGQALMAAFGTDTIAEAASYVVTGHTVFTVVLNTNDYLDMTEDGGAPFAIQLTAGTYTANELCAHIKSVIEAGNGTATYTVTFSTTTKKFTLTKNSGVFVIKFATGTNTAKCAASLLGFSVADTTSAISAVSNLGVTFAAANDAIPFTEDAGSEVTAYLTPGTYVMGTSSAVAGSLCKLVKDQMEAANGTAETYTVTYSHSTKKMTITKGTGVFVLRWTTGVNANIAAMSLLGFTANSASAIAATSDSVTAGASFTHTFTRLSAAQLPTYSFWFDKGAVYPQFKGSMLNKMDLSIKSKEFVTLDTDWTALGYDATGVAKTPTYSPLKPFRWHQAVLTVDGVGSLDYDNLQLSIDNLVNAEHALSGSIYTSKIWSEGFRVTLSADLFFEDSAQYAKFLAGTTSSFTVVLTSDESNGGAAYTLTITIPILHYTAAPLHNPTGVMKIPFAGVARFDTVSGVTMSMALKNSRVTAY